MEVREGKGGMEGRGGREGREGRLLTVFTSSKGRRGGGGNFGKGGEVAPNEPALQNALIVNFATDYRALPRKGLVSDNAPPVPARKVG